MTTSSETAVAQPAEASSRWIVMTTIHPPGEVLQALQKQLDAGWSMVVVGDEATPAVWRDRPIDYLSLGRQRESFGAFAAAAPTRHYSRKNFGYLHALQRGAEQILELDDDNVPRSNFGVAFDRDVRGRLVGGGDWVNVYRWFTEELLWPRGLPLDAIHNRGALEAEVTTRACPAQQYLVDGDPDVDAIHRLVFGVREHSFAPDAAPVVLAPGTWCPFNSQNTLWLEEAFPLLYLPHHCSFRMTDIWRSLVAQCALWTRGGTIAFHGANVHQARNPHDLARDFADEVPGHLGNRAIAQRLGAAAEPLAGQPLDEVGRSLWLELVDTGVLPDRERLLIDHWFDAIRACRAHRPAGA